jgi:hypothetical protein
MSDNAAIKPEKSDVTKEKGEGENGAGDEPSGVGDKPPAEDGTNTDTDTDTDTDIEGEGDGSEGDGSEGDGSEGDGSEGDGSEGDGSEGDGSEGYVTDTKMGGGGYAASDISMLGGDPLFLVLSEFFSSSHKGRNIADILEDINGNLAKLAKKM